MLQITLKLKTKLLPLIFILVIGMNKTYATNFVWKTTVALGNWNNPNNWTGGSGTDYPGSNPASTADVATFSSNAAVTMPVTGVFYNTITTLTVNNGITVSITMTAVAGVGPTLTISGNINVGTSSTGGAELDFK